MTEKKYSKDHEWVMIENEIATVGITNYAQESLGDIVFIELPETGKSIKMGDQQIYDGHTLGIPSELKQQLIDLLQSKNFDPSIVSF